jgi:hypothetical protein
MKIYHQNDSTVRRNLGISTTWRPSYLTLWQSGLSLLETRVMGSKLLPPSLLNISGTRDVLGALTFAPRQLLALLRILRTGVPDAQDVHNVAQALNGIPGCAWEQFDGPAVPPAVQGPRMVRITRATMDFWTELVAIDLSSGQGSLSQTVQVPNWRVERSCEWCE